MDILLYVKSQFLFATFKILSDFWQFDYNVACCTFLWVHLIWCSLNFLDTMSISFPRFWKKSVQSEILEASNNFSLPKEKQELWVFVCLLCAELRGGELWCLLVHATVFIISQVARLCWTCQSSKTGKSDDISLGNPEKLGHWMCRLNLFLFRRMLGAGIFFIHSLFADQGRRSMVSTSLVCHHFHSSSSR